MIPKAYVDADPSLRERSSPTTGLSDGPATGDAGADPMGEAEPRWFTLAEPQAAAELMKLWTDQNPLRQKDEAQWEANELRREGVAGVKVIKNPQTGQYYARAPLSGRATLEAYNYARITLQSYVGNLLVDPPAPEVEPTDGGEDDRDAAEVAMRALEDLQSSARLNTQGALRDMLDLHGTFGSGFRFYYLHPTGGGRVPTTVEASPLAAEAAHPLADPLTGMPHADPMTGEVPPPVTRYVHQDGQSLTDAPAEALHEWRPDLCGVTLTGRNVRFLPHNADLRDAYGALVLLWTTWGQAKRMHPTLAALSEEERTQIAQYRPDNSDASLPEEFRGRRLTGDDAPVCQLHVILEECDEYPDGFYGVVVGGRRVPYRKPWVAETPDGKGGTRREALLLPVAQLKGMANGKRTPYGTAPMEDLGGANELVNAAVGYTVSHVEKWGDLPIFLPIGSTLQTRDLSSGQKVALVPPQGQPFAIQPQPMDPAITELFQMSREYIERAAHHQDTANLTGPNVSSGRQAYQAVAQTHAQLAEMQQNIGWCYERMCQIEMQLARAFGIDGETRYTGPDGQYKVRRWQASDLVGDVRLKPGTLTMLSPQVKLQQIDALVAQQRLPADEANDLAMSLAGPMLGYRDNPFRLEIRRQIATWEQGPPEGWSPPQAVQTTQAQVVTDPQTGQPVGQQLVPATVMQQAPEAQAAEQGIFPPKPSHSLPGVAQIRVTELARVMASMKYEGMQPVEWRAVLDREFQRCQQLAAPPQMMAPGQPGAGGQDAAQQAQAAKPPAFGPQAGVPPMDNPATLGNAA